MYDKLGWYYYYVFRKMFCQIIICVLIVASWDWEYSERVSAATSLVPPARSHNASAQMSWISTSLHLWVKWHGSPALRLLLRSPAVFLFFSSALMSLFVVGHAWPLCPKTIHSTRFHNSAGGIVEPVSQPASQPPRLLNQPASLPN